MQDISFFKDFYKKCIVSIGEKDKSALESWLQQKKDVNPRTHWLIGLIWYEDERTTGWKVGAYPINEDKPYWHFPYYYLTVPNNFDTALKTSIAWGNYSSQDMLTNVYQGLS